jgi:hypothetical protein
MHQNEPSKQLNQDRHNVLLQAVTDLRFESASQAHLVRRNVNPVSRFARSIVAPSPCGAVLGNFEPAMKRWRWDGDDLQKPIRWPIPQKREVQDIVCLALRSYFSDVIDEDTLPKPGHSS